MTDSTSLSRDPILRGRLVLWQPQKGYRFSIDPLLLADFVGTSQGPLGRLCDIGAGVGVVGLLLGKSDPRAQVTLVELQPRLAELCRKNAAENGLADRCTVVEGDVLSAPVRKLLPGAGFDLVASCPPYYQVGRGGVNPDSEEAIARHELHLPLGELVRAARRLVGFRGRVALVYPSPRLPELLSSLQSAGLTPTRLRLVHPHPGEPAQRALVEGRKGARGGLDILPPLFLRHPDGNYTDEARRILGES
jgi:tRNA1Val (adenine37-N6)-methyltransferase